MKKLVVGLLVLAIVLSFAPVYADGSFALKGIEDGERIPVSADPASFSRVISIVDATATARAITAATNFAKAEFYIDDVLAATVTDNPCKWALPITDLNSHTLKATVTDGTGGTQEFGPYTYTAVYMEDGASSLVEPFEGTVDEAYTASTRIPTVTSKNNPVYATLDGGEGTVLKLTMSSGNNTTLQTTQDILVPEQGMIVYNLDIYSTSGSQYMKFYLYTRHSSEAGKFFLKNGNWEMMPNVMMSELGKDAWHHITFIFDTTRGRYCGSVDGYEFDRGAMDTAILGRDVYFRFDTQTYSSGDIYLDNLEILSKTEAKTNAAVMTEDGDDVNAVVLNSSDTATTFNFYRAEYAADDMLVDISVVPVTLAPKAIWTKTVSAVPATGAKSGVYILDPKLIPLAKAVER